MNLRANLVFALLLAPLGIGAQEAKPLPSADERFKADILLVVAHPDEEGGATPYLARAIYDEHKRVAVVFATRGGSGGEYVLRGQGGARPGSCGQEPGRGWTRAWIPTLVWCGSTR